MNPPRSTRMPVVYIVCWLLTGTLFVALVYFADSAQSWRLEGRLVFGFFYTYVLGLVSGFAVQIIAALVVRWLTHVTRLNALIPWLGYGAIVGIVVPWALARAGYLLEGIHFPQAWQTIKAALMFPMMGPMMYGTQPIWVMSLVGAATAGTVRLSMRWLLRTGSRSSLEFDIT
jgi:hypothetical protein